MAMAPASFERSPVRYARIGGWMYLAIIVLGLFGEAWVRGTLVVSGDAAATAANIQGVTSLWRLGVAGDLLMHVLDVPLIVILYLLLRPVSVGLAMLATVFNVVQTAVLAANKLTLLAPIFLLEGSATALPAEVAQGLAYLAIKAHGYGFGIGLVFFGFACLVRGYLITQCDYLPRMLGYLLLAAGASYLVNSFALLLAPDLASALFPLILLPAFVGELSLALWLAFKGVDAGLFQRAVDPALSR
jgi:Domain of unknown function (DUF4386)